MVPSAQKPGEPQVIVVGVVALPPKLTNSDPPLAPSNAAENAIWPGPLPRDCVNVPLPSSQAEGSDVGKSREPESKMFPLGNEAGLAKTTVEPKLSRTPVQAELFPERTTV